MRAPPLCLRRRAPTSAPGSFSTHPLRCITDTRNQKLKRALALPSTVTVPNAPCNHRHASLSRAAFCFSEVPGNSSSDPLGRKQMGKLGRWQILPSFC